eukprot:2762510-Prorocentrum_lima.AAC.1
MASSEPCSNDRACNQARILNSVAVARRPRPTGGIVCSWMPPLRPLAATNRHSPSSNSSRVTGRKPP